MGFFNRKLIEAMLTGRYACPECGARMEFEDEWEETLICPECGHEMDIERYGFEGGEEYESLYPAEKEFEAGMDGEKYADAYGGLDEN